MARCQVAQKLTTNPAIFIYCCAQERCGRGHLILSVLQAVQQPFRKWQGRWSLNPGVTRKGRARERLASGCTLSNVIQCARRSPGWKLTVAKGLVHTFRCSNKMTYLDSFEGLYLNLRRDANPRITFCRLLLVHRGTCEASKRNSTCIQDTSSGLLLQLCFFFVMTHPQSMLPVQMGPNSLSL